MTPAPANQPSMPSYRDDAIAIIRRLRDNGHIAYLAGGCVRDELLGLAAKDFDVATDAPPARVQQLFAKTQAVGVAFGVILVRQGRSMVEVATFRTDGSYSDGRRPDSVTFATAEADAQRRDFTINGLFFDPIDNRVIDFVGGQADLRARVLRAIGDPQHRFAEDYLRMLRAMRFAARFDLTIEPQTEAAIRKFAGKLIEISPERIADELRAMLTPPTRAKAWRLLGDFGLLAVIFRFLKQTRFWPPYTDPLFDPIVPALAPGKPTSFPLALAAIAIDVLSAGANGQPLHVALSDRGIGAITAALRKSLRFSNDEEAALAALLSVASLLDPDRPPSVARMKRFLATPTAAEARWLLDAIAAGYSTDRPRIGWLRERFSELEQTEFAPPPLVTGDDLVAAGLPPGPRFKRILDQTYDEQLEGRLSTKPEAMAFALRVP